MTEATSASSRRHCCRGVIATSGAISSGGAHCCCHGRPITRSTRLAHDILAHCPSPWRNHQEQCAVVCFPPPRYAGRSRLRNARALLIDTGGVRRNRTIYLSLDGFFIDVYIISLGDSDLECNPSNRCLLRKRYNYNHQRENQCWFCNYI